MKNKKLNVIDYLILAVLVAAVALVGVKLLKNRSAADGETIQEATKSDDGDAVSLRFTVLCPDLDPQLAQEVQKELAAPDYEINGKEISTGRIFNSNVILDGEVTDCTAEETEEGLVSLRITVEAEPTYAAGTYTLGWQELRLGKEYTLKTLGLELLGSIVAMEKLG